MNSDFNEEELNKIIIEYCDAQSSGRPTSREDVLLKYPQYQEELLDFFDNFDLFSPSSLSDSKVKGFPSSNSDSDSFIEDIHLDKYTMIEEIGRGGIGIVYLALDKSLNRKVAIKVIPKNFLKSEKDQKRIQIEAESTAQLNHNHIVKIYEYGSEDTFEYIVMEYIEGSDLAEKLNQGTLFPHEAAILIKKIADAISVAHKNGILHRDLKPANILLDAEDQPHLSDFGLAYRTQQDDLLTQTGEIIGTPRYMAPEQARGVSSEELTPSVDIYSLGVVLYHCLCGCPPFDSQTTLGLLKKIVEEEPPLLKTIKRNTPADLEAICLKCLEKDPKNRYENSEELCEDLNRFLNDQPTKARPLNPIQTTIRKTLNKKQRAFIIKGSLLFIPLLMVSFWFFYSYSKSEFHTFVENYPGEISKLHQALLDGKLETFNQQKEKLTRQVSFPKLGTPIELAYLKQLIYQNREVLSYDSKTLPISPKEDLLFFYKDSKFHLLEYPSLKHRWTMSAKNFSGQQNQYRRNILWSSDQKTIYLSTSNAQRSGSLVSIRTQDGEQLKEIKYTEPNQIVRSLYFTPNQKMLIAVLEGGNHPNPNSQLPLLSIAILNPQNLKPIHPEIQLSSWHQIKIPLTVDRFKNELLFVDEVKTDRSFNKVIRRWSLETGEEQPFYSADFTRDNQLFTTTEGRFLAITSRDQGKIDLYRLDLKSDNLIKFKTKEFKASGIIQSWNRPSETSLPQHFALSVLDGWIHILRDDKLSLKRRTYISTDSFGRTEFALSGMRLTPNALWVQLNGKTLRYPLNRSPHFFIDTLDNNTWDLAIHETQNKKTIFTGTNSGTYQSWKLLTYPDGEISIELQGTKSFLNHPDEDPYFSLSPNGSYLFKGSNPRASILTIAPKSLERTLHAELELQGDTKAAIFSKRSATKLAVITATPIPNDDPERALYFYDIPSSNQAGKLKPSFKFVDSNYRVRNLAFNSRESLLAVAPRNSSPIHIYNWSTQTKVAELPHYNHSNTAISFSNDDSWFCVAQEPDYSGEDKGHPVGLVEIWNTKTWKLADRFEVGKHRVNCVKFSPDDSRILTANSDGYIQIWLRLESEIVGKEILKRDPVFTFERMPINSNWLQFTRDGNTLIGVGGHGDIGSQKATGILSAFSLFQE